MTQPNLQALSERERECLAHLAEAKKLGVSFSQYAKIGRLACTSGLGSSEHWFERV